MKEIFQIINRILIEKHEVELPAFGRFKGEVKNSEIHPVDNRFSPKYLNISFVLNKNATGDEIIKELSKDLKISQQQAEKKLEDFKNEVLQKLKKGEKVLFKELGYMYWKAGHLYFEQDRKFNYLKESFGLGSFNQEIVERERPKAPPKELVKPKEKKSYKKLIIGIAASVIILALAAGAYLKRDLVSQFYNNTFNKNVVVENKNTTDTTNIEVDTSEAIAVNNADSNEIVIDSNEIIADIDTVEEVVAAVDNKEGEIVKTEQKKEIVKQVEPSPNDRYYLIAGCFREYNKATDFVIELKSKGYEAELRGKTNGLHRVIYSAHPNYSSALGEMKDIIDKEGRGPWIQKIK